jgi:hypothetical protein
MSWTPINPGSSDYISSYIWTLSNGTTGTVTTASVSITGQTEGSYLTVTVKTVFTSTSLTMISVPSIAIPVQLAPPMRTIILSGTPTNTGFSIQWNNITVPASSPYTLSYTYSGSYTGLQPGTRTTGATVTTWQFTLASLANGGTVTGLFITAIYTSGPITLSTVSNILSPNIIIPPLPPIITNFTFTRAVGGYNYSYTLDTTKGVPSNISCTITFVGGPITNQFGAVVGESTYQTVGVSSTSPGTLVDTTIILPYSAMLYNFNIMSYTTTYLNSWRANNFNPRLTVSNSVGSHRLELSTRYDYMPGIINLTIANTRSYNAGKYCLYIKLCERVTSYTVTTTAGIIASYTAVELINTDTVDDVYMSITNSWRGLLSYAASNTVIPQVFTIRLSNNNIARTIVIRITAMTRNSNNLTNFTYNISCDNPSYNMTGIFYTPVNLGSSQVHTF